LLPISTPLWKRLHREWVIRSPKLGRHLAFHRPKIRRRFGLEPIAVVLSVRAQVRPTMFAPFSAEVRARRVTV